jgi:hypothetical protein
MGATMSCCDPRSGGPGNDSEDELLAGDQQDKYLATTSSRDEAAAAAPPVPEQKMPETERQPPAVRDQPPAALDAPPAAEPPTPPVAPAAPAAAPGPRHVGVLRHAERIDTLEPAEVEALVGEQFAWPDRVARPYDTPISDFDHPRRAAAQLKEFGFTRVVSSPFRRCLQTAAVAAAELGIEVVDVHKGIGEAMAQVKRNGWPDEPGGHELTYLTEEEMGTTLAAAARAVDGGSAVRLGEVSGDKPSFGQDDVGRIRWMQPLLSPPLPAAPLSLFPPSLLPFPPLCELPGI